jgi:signal transduction histidine kinase
MSLKSLKLWSKTVGFRLAIWYSTIFILSSVALFVFAYFFLSSSIQQRDQDLVQSRLKEFQSQYATGGIETLKSKILSEKPSSRGNPFFVRVAGPTGNTLFLNKPHQWTDFDLRGIGVATVDGKERWISVTSTDDENALEIASIRLHDDNVLQVGKSTAGREELLENFRTVFSGILIPTVLIGFIGGQLLSLRALRPIRRLTATVRSVIETGKTDVRIPSENTKDELDELVILFNEMLEKIEILIKGMKQALDNVAHDLRTPMMRLRGIAETALQREQKIETCQEALSDCLEESERVVTMMNTLMDISEAETGTLRLDPQTVDLSILLENVVELYRYVADDKNITLHTNCPSQLYVYADPNRIRQVLANLLDNAVKYTLSGGRVEVEACLRQRQVAILIRDTGTGISPEEIPKIWDRLHRGNKSRSQRGLGLGLSLVKAIVQAHRGEVEVSSQLGRGSIFAVYLPHEI